MFGFLTHSALCESIFGMLVLKMFEPISMTLTPPSCRQARYGNIGQCQEYNGIMHPNNPEFTFRYIHILVSDDDIRVLGHLRVQEQREMFVGKRIPVVLSKRQPFWVQKFHLQLRLSRISQRRHGSRREQEQTKG